MLFASFFVLGEFDASERADAEFGRFIIGVVKEFKFGEGSQRLFIDEDLVDH